MFRVIRLLRNKFLGLTVVDGPFKRFLKRLFYLLEDWSSLMRRFPLRRPLIVLRLLSFRSISNHYNSFLYRSAILGIGFSSNEFLEHSLLFSSKKLLFIEVFITFLESFFLIF